MGKTVLVTGGARSGKTAFALRQALERPAPRLYMATAEPGDDEMSGRIELHRIERAGLGFDTLESPLELASAIRQADARYGAIIVDCLTLWLSNLMHASRDIMAETSSLMEALGSAGPDVWLVTNEVGLGIVPENELARAFRDHSGRLNATVARAADEAWFCVSGIPMKLK